MVTQSQTTYLHSNDEQRIQEYKLETLEWSDWLELEDIELIERVKITRTIGSFSWGEIAGKRASIYYPHFWPDGPGEPQWKSQWKGRK